MRSAKAVLASLSLTVFVAGCSAPSRTPRLVSASQLHSAGYFKYWDAELPLTEDDTVLSATLLDDNLYVISRMGDVYCISGEQGLLRWTRTLSQETYTIHPPRHQRNAAGDGPAVFVTTSRTYLLDRYSGEEVFSFTPEFSPGGPALADGTKLYMGGSNGRFYSIFWDHHFDTGPIQNWEVHTGSPVTAAPVLHGRDQLIFATQGGSVVSCGALRKTGQWVARTESAVVADPQVDDTGVYVASTDRSLYRFDLQTGAERWRYRFPGPLTDAPVLARFTCYQYCPRTGLTAIDVDSGQEKWVRRDGVGFVAAAPGQTAIQTRSGIIDIVDAQTGETLHWFDQRGHEIAVRNTRDDRIILVSPDGHIVCARAETTPYLKIQQVRSAERTLTQSPSSLDGTADPLPAGSRSAPQIDYLRSERDRG